MKTIKSARDNRIRLQKLALAISTQILLAASVNAAPTGGSVVGGAGDISQSGNHTRITQGSNRLAIDWDTFDVGTGESVQFVQPSTEAIALNRILDADASQILGRIDANGRIVLMNPNGLTFGENSTVNVQSLIASGLNIATDDFMSGDLSFAGVEGAGGVVISGGIINAATGGNVALLGKQVENRGLITARLGRVALAAGNEAVLTFDDAGLLGVRIDEATLSEDMEGNNAVINRGGIRALGGRILLDASVSEDLFSAAVNHGQLPEGVEAVIHSDGSFTLGDARGVLNEGHLNASKNQGSRENAGQVLMAGQTVTHRGGANVSTAGAGLAGDIRLQANDTVALGRNSEIFANNSVGAGGNVQVQGKVVRADGSAEIQTTGNVSVVGSQNVRLAKTSARHLRIEAGGEIRQVGRMDVDGRTHIATTSSKDIRLDHANNDFGSISLDSQQGSQVTVVDRNSIALGNIRFENGSMKLRSTGKNAEISQLADSSITVNNGNLVMSADNIVLGGNGSHTDINGSLLHLEFRDSINTNGSITLADTTQGAMARISSNGAGAVAINLEAQKEIDLVAQIQRDEYDQELEINIERMLGNTALFFGHDTDVSQTGPIVLSDTLTWNGRSANLTHAENDVRSITRYGRYLNHFGSLKFFDKNDLEIGVYEDIGGEDFVDISAGGDIVQSPETLISVGELTLHGNRIFLGAQGTSRTAAWYSINLEFQDELWLDGDISSGPSAGGGISITGTDGNNRLVFGENLNDLVFNPGSYVPLIVHLMDGDDRVFVYGGNVLSGSSDHSEVPDSRFDLGAGNDQLHLYDNLQIKTYLGEGRDVVTINRPELNTELVDFDPAEDVSVQTFP